ncbi:hypothetical protein [Chryseobacterium sp. SORGH_AS_1048]|uniref:hypothetical protein n=1 Tax=Chryseobacterium sp. SORGH_AS_1048 TaxID=3041783 RepID=UPI00277ED8C0|nr:hypothetical protein [Chryseobacterium sp. SORGH_AS_1048]MDQ1099467.1 hypothetical protein [Chryseobacterium sp. SORGH_AS_1048]
MIKFKEKYIQSALVIITVMMTILRFLLNEKGRITPDSIRFMRFASRLPVIDNTIAPPGYPAAIRLVTYLGTDEFWSSKIIGIVSLLGILFFAWRKKFYFREALLTCSLFSFVSIFSFTLSEALLLPFGFILLYVSDLVIREKLQFRKAVFYLSFLLILMYTIRYNALFIIGACGLFGLLHLRKKYSAAFTVSAAIACVYILAYKFLFIDYFTQDYLKNVLEDGPHNVPQLLTELFQGLCTTFNPFIHIASPGGGIVNYGIYGVGCINLMCMIFLFFKYQLNQTESYFIFIGITGIGCTFLIQFFYPLDVLDYRLLAPFSFPIWIIYFRKLFSIFSLKLYAVGALSLITGGIFTWLSRGDYLENRKEVSRYLKSEKLETATLRFYVNGPDDMEGGQMAETDQHRKPQNYSSKNTGRHA